MALFEVDLAPMRKRAVIPACLFVLASTAAQAQWWPFAPRDYEDCAAQAERSDAGKEARAKQVAECEAKFSGRRKPGGGYAYYDFMQDRTFDIAGPNPTPDELKRIDQEYTAYLERQRHDAIVAALTDKQRRQNEAATIRSIMADKPDGMATGSIVAAPPAAPARHAPVNRTAAVHAPRPHCESRLSCTWTDFSEGVRNLFGPPPKTRPPARI